MILKINNTSLGWKISSYSGGPRYIRELSRDRKIGIAYKTNSHIKNTEDEFKLKDRLTKANYTKIRS
jgi:hypothetical protein